VFADWRFRWRLITFCVGVALTLAKLNCKSIFSRVAYAKSVLPAKHNHRKPEAAALSRAWATVRVEVELAAIASLQGVLLIRGG
jgi:hypothetical protein